MTDEKKIEEEALEASLGNLDVILATAFAQLARTILEECDRRYEKKIKPEEYSG